MRVLYLYATERSSVQEGAERGMKPDTLLYGLNHMADFGHDAEFFDEDRRLRSPYREAQTLASLVIRQTAHRWNLGQALQSLTRLQDYDCVFATSDSTGLPLAFLKRLGCWQGRLIMASQGLTQSLATQGWNWAFRLHRWSLSAIDHIVVYGWGERQEIIDHFGVPPEKVGWIPVGVDTEFYARCLTRQPDVKEDVVLSVGRDRCRDFNALFQAAESLPNIPFRIITSRGRFANVRLPANVYVLYELPIQEVVSHYAACRFVVLPVEDSPYSFATTTAFDVMAMGKAVVLSRNRAVGPDGDGYELVDGEHCRFVSAGDAEALSGVIGELWANPGFCDELGRRAQSQVNSMFTTRILAQRLKEVFMKESRPAADRRQHVK
jgi:glycosyltransferase involved in cell wall biosynthesis